MKLVYEEEEAEIKEEKGGSDGEKQRLVFVLWTLAKRGG